MSCRSCCSCCCSCCSCCCCCWSSIDPTLPGDTAWARLWDLVSRPREVYCCCCCLRTSSNHRVEGVMPVSYEELSRWQSCKRLEVRGKMRSCASRFGGKDGNTSNATKGSESSCCHTRVNNNKTCPGWGRARVYHARSSMSTPGLSGPKPWMHQPAS